MDVGWVTRPKEKKETMKKIRVSIVVDTDNDTDVTDGLNEGFRSLATEYGFIVDWSYNEDGRIIESVPIQANDYVEGQAWA